MRTKEQKEDIFRTAKNNITQEIIKKEVLSCYPDAKLSGEWWSLKCPFHDDQKPSMGIHREKGHFKCHGCDEKGDFIIFLTKTRNISRREAAEYILQLNGNAVENTKIYTKKDKLPNPLIPIPTTALQDIKEILNDDYYRQRHGNFQNYWVYANSNNEIVFIIARFQNKTGKKIIPFYYGVNNEWISKKPYPDNLPLYNLPMVIENPDVPVVIVEGEKCCDALFSKSHYENFIPCSWSFGAHSVNKTDWEPLRGRSIIIWPDADKAGRDAAKEIANILNNLNCTIKQVVPPEDVPEGWDCADAIDDNCNINELISQAQPWDLTPETNADNESPADISKNTKEKKESKSVTETAIRIIKDNARIFSDGETGYAVFSSNGHSETAPINSRQFKKYARWVYRKNENRGLNENVVREILNELESFAIYEGIPATTYTRIGKGQGGNIIINPAWDDWNIIEVTPAGWAIKDPVTLMSAMSTIESQSHPLFIRSSGMLPLVRPEKGKGCLNDLRPFLCAHEDEHKFVLIISFIMQTFFYHGPFPILVLIAEPGSGKSFATNIIKQIVDPHEVMTISVPREERDLFAASGVSWLMAFDNFSSVPPWLSDVFCRLSTGGGTIDRLMRTNNEAHIYSAKRPAIVNGITDFFNRSDIMQRSLIMDFGRINPEKRRDEYELWNDFYRVAPGIFYDILDLLVKVLQFLPAVKVNNPPRMIDFCKIGTATGMALGLKDSAFMDIYNNNIKSSNEIALESSVIFSPLQTLMNFNPTIECTATELLSMLNRLNPEASKSKYWPKTPSMLSGQLNRLAQNLRAIGYDVEMWRDNSGRNIKISNKNFTVSENSVMNDIADTGGDIEL